MSNNRFMPTAPKTPLEYDHLGRPLCRWCKNSVPSFRQSFCSKQCVEEWRFRTDSSFVREKIFERDGGTCAHCGINCKALKTAIFEATGDYLGVPTQWQSHHIKAVSVGGGLCGLSGYATLCLKCHAKETAHLKAERDEARKWERIHQILFFLEDWRGTTQEIARAINLSKSQVNKYLKQMHEAGLVNHSQRSALYFVTSAGIMTLQADSTSLVFASG